MGFICISATACTWMGFICRFLRTRHIICWMRCVRRGWLLCVLQVFSGTGTGFGVLLGGVRVHVRLIELDDAAHIRILDLHPVLDAMQELVLFFLRQVPWCDEIEHQIDELLRLRTVAARDKAVLRMLFFYELRDVGGMPDTEIMEAAFWGEL